jgi:hypothetical protein
MQDEVEKPTVSLELRTLIESKVQALMADSAPDHVDLRQIATDKHALLLYADMGGALALRPNGEVISFRWDRPESVETENDPRIRNLALFQGSKRYPELEQFIPPRPSAAKTCPHCHGTGVAPEAASLGIGNIVCYCGGLGWVP